MIARRRLTRVLRSIETPLIVAGLALLAYWAAAHVDGTVASAQALREFEAAQGAARTAAPSLPGNAQTPQPGAPADSEPNQSLWGQSRIAAYRASLEARVEAPAGVLTIPKIDLRAPVFEGTADITLNRGVGRIEGTAPIGTRGNVGVAGHRDGFFRGLKDVTVGDAIDVQSHDGTLRYRVTEILIVEPTDVYVLDPTSAATLTLVTCYPFYFVGSAPQRYIVKAAAAE